MEWEKVGEGTRRWKTMEKGKEQRSRRRRQGGGGERSEREAVIAI